MPDSYQLLVDRGTPHLRPAAGATATLIDIFNFGYYITQCYF